MLDDDRILSVGNVYNAVKKRYDISKYTKLAYLQSSGEQYIDTGYKPNQNTKLEIKFFSYNRVGSTGICVTDQTWGSNGFGIWDNAIGVDDYTAYYDTGYSDTSIDNSRYLITAVLTNNSFSKNGSIVKTFGPYNDFSCPYNITMFCLNRGGATSYYASVRIYYCKIYENDILVRDYIPVKKDGIAGMYDKIGKKFYSNSGTGTFIEGPERKLPSDYVELEYLQSQATTSSDGSYINTGLKPTSNAILIIDYQFTDVSNHVACCVFGSSTSSAGNPYRFLYREGPPNDAWRFDRGNQTKIDIFGTFERHTISVYQNEVTFENYSKIISSGSFSAASTDMFMFASSTGTNPTESTNLKIYSFEYYDGINRRFFIPAKQLSNGKVGMYDLESKTFYPNSGGQKEFIGGSEILFEDDTVQVPEDVNLLANLDYFASLFDIPVNGSLANRPMSVKNLKTALNSVNKYAYLEYIQSQATGQNDGPYIDLNIPVSSNAQITCDFQYVNVDNHTHCAIFGARGAASSYTNRFVLNYNNGGWRFDYNNANYSVKDSNYLNRLTVYVNGKDVEFSDGVSLSANSGSFMGQYSLYLFANNTGGTLGECSNLKIYSFTLSDGNNLINLVPCKRKKDGVIGMLDTNSETFYSNAGNQLGFIAGPEI